VAAFEHPQRLLEHLDGALSFGRDRLGTLGPVPRFV